MILFRREKKVQHIVKPYKKHKVGSKSLLLIDCKLTNVTGKVRDILSSNTIFVPSQIPYNTSPQENI